MLTLPTSRGWALVLVLTAASAHAQQPAPVSLTVEDAVELALVQSYAVRRAVLEAERADAQVQEARAAVLPNVTSQSSYTRNVATPSPFAGTSAEDAFGGMGATDFLLFNERARTDDDPATVPVSFDAFQRRQAAGIREAGGDPDDRSGPSFNVPNQFRTGVSFEQALLDPAAFSALEAARTLGDAAGAAALRQAQTVADSVRRAYYRVLLAQTRADVLEQSAARAAETVQDAEALVEQGLASVYRRSSAQVELTNTRTDQLEAENDAAVARDALKLAVGLPPALEVRLTSSLEAAPFAGAVDVDRAVGSALERRADVRRARLTVAARETQADATRYQLYPRLSAFADLAYVGNVPDDRSRIVQSGPGPFDFEEQTRGVFSDAYWSPAVNAGLRLRWSLFDGGAVRARLNQDLIEARLAEVRLRELEDAVAFQVERAVRDLESARERYRAQADNVDLAEQNYSFVRRRVLVGLADDLERREASDQLDRARLGLARATFDVLEARSQLEAAVGTPVVAPPVERVIIDVTTDDSHR